MKIQLILLAVIFGFTRSAMSDDQVDQMPGWPKTKYGIYSGMLNANESGSRQLHYFFIESQSNPVKDDLVVWLNGGPGCSSLLGMIQENGPFQFRGINMFFTDMQEYAWNKEANVLYIESPAGVGFSINNDEKYEYTDDNTANDMMYAFNEWRSRFQESPIGIKDKKTWISGESYGGMYIPFFANAIVDQNDAKTHDNINLAGFLIGNGAWILNWDFLGLYQINTYPAHQFFNPEITNQWYEGCLKGQQGPCEEFLQYYSNVSNNTDTYQIYNYTYTYGQGQQQNRQGDMLIQKAQQIMKNYLLNKENEKMEEMFKDTSKYSSFPTPDGIIQSYFNLPEVKEALHVDTNINWEQCSMKINQNYHSAKNSTHLYPKFFDKGLQILIFSGNTDGAVPYTYSWYCMKDLMENYPVKMTVIDKWRQWGPQSDKQVGGMVQTWSASETSDSKFTFAMVRSAGHEVPMYQPLSAFNMFYNFTHGLPI